MGSSKKNLSIRERMFLKNILTGMTQKAAYKAIIPDVSDAAAEQGGWKYMRRLRQKYPWEELLDAWDLGIERIAKKLEELLEATAPRFHQDVHLGDWPDNAARGRALELLADFHKMRLQKVELTGKDGGPLEVLTTLNDIVKYAEEHKPDSPEIPD